MKYSIAVEGLSKCYQISPLKGGYGMFRETLAGRWQRREPQRLFWALKELNFSVEQGCSFALIGRNGAGKSTLLKILSRVIHPTSGAARVRGRVAGLLAVGEGFHPELTGGENIYLSGAILGMSRSATRRRFEQIVAFAQLEPWLHEPVKHYSSGMALRLAFALGAHLDPDILLVDEALAVGDAAFQKKCLERLLELRQEGRTILFVSHDQELLTKLCSHGLLLESGRLIQQGPIGECLSAYRKQMFHVEQ